MMETVTLVLNRDGTQKICSSRITWLDARRWAESGYEVFRFERNDVASRMIYVNAPVLLGPVPLGQLDPASGGPVTTNAAPPMRTVEDPLPLTDFDKKREA